MRLNRESSEMGSEVAMDRLLNECDTLNELRV